MISTNTTKVAFAEPKKRKRANLMSAAVKPKAYDLRRSSKFVGDLDLGSSFRFLQSSDLRGLEEKKKSAPIIIEKKMLRAKFKTEEQREPVKKTAKRKPGRPKKKAG